MKATFIAVSIFLFIFFISSAFLKEQSKYKNLKILPKSIKKAELDSVMFAFCDALKVKCGFCHVRIIENDKSKWNFPSDEKEEKNTARKMLVMMYKLNKKNFHIKHPDRLKSSLKVTCFTCHRGSTKPENIPLPIK